MINSLILIGFGLAAALGGLNYPLTILGGCVNGGISLGMSIYLYIKFTKPKLKELEEIENLKDDKLKNQKMKDYLINQIMLSKTELSTIQKTKEKYTSENSNEPSKKMIKEWIEKNQSTWNQSQKDKWEKVKKDLDRAEKTELEKIVNEIINEEIKIVQEDKLEKFRALVDFDTYKNIVNIVQTCFENNTDAEILEAFIKTKRAIKIKSCAEMAKWVLYSGLFLIPLSTLTVPHVFEKYYGITNAGVDVLGLFMGCFPWLRNIPPSVDKEDFEINNEISKLQQH